MNYRLDYAERNMRPRIKIPSSITKNDMDQFFSNVVARVSIKAENARLYLHTVTLFSTLDESATTYQIAVTHNDLDFCYNFVGLTFEEARNILTESEEQFKIKHKDELNKIRQTTSMCYEDY